MRLCGFVDTRRDLSEIIISTRAFVREDFRERSTFNVVAGGGGEWVRLIEKAKSDRSVLSSITFKSGATKDGLLLVTGEQGVLYYDPATNKVEFDRLEDVKSVAWLR
jgi:hypothetical protein